MFSIGIDLGGTNIAVGLVDENGKIVLKDSVPTYRERNYQEIIKDMAMLSLKVVKDAGITLQEVNSIGVGSPGTPDNKNGLIIYNGNLNFRNTPIRSEMRKYIDLPIYIENDANCAALAESVAGAAKHVDHSVTITLGTGVGGGIVINKKVYSGFNNAASELGHMAIMMNGEQCTCGRKGCFEAYASATALIRQTKEAVEKHPESIIYTLIEGNLNNITAKTAFDAARLEDPTGKEVVNYYIHYLAEGITNIINILEPQVIAIGGGICKEGDYLLKPLRELIYQSCFGGDKIPYVEIREAQLGNDAGIIGAAMLYK